MCSQALHIKENGVRVLATGILSSFDADDLVKAHDQA
jgi:hypothetical protein